MKTMVSRWNQYAKDDPLWIILTHPEKRGSWDQEEFFATGRKDVDLSIQQIKEAGVTELSGKAMDFGCGVGRLSQALAEYFDEVVGVDVSKEMIKQGEALVPEGMKLSFIINEAEDLSQIADDEFDFVYTLIVLQHIHPQISHGYLKEFARIVKPGGHVFFQLPAERLDRDAACKAEAPEAGKSLKSKLSTLKYSCISHMREFKARRKEKQLVDSGKMIVEMHGTGKDEVVQLMESAGLKLIDCYEDMGLADGWKSYRYLFTKPVA